MDTSNSRIYQKGESSSKPFAGFNITIYGLNIGFIRLVMIEGEVTVTTNEQTTAEQIAVPDGAEPCLYFNSPVSRIGPNGPTIGDMSLFISWDGVEFAGDGIEYVTINDFLDQFTQMYTAGYKAFASLNATELAKLAGVPTFPPPASWGGVSNDILPVVSLAPNPLNLKQAKADSELPVQFTAVSVTTPDFKHYLAYKLEIKENRLSAVIEFSAWPDPPKGKPELLKTFDVTSQLPATLPFMYFTYWVDAYAANPKKPLDHILLSLPASYNSTVMSGYIPNTQVVYNVHIKQTYGGNTLTPLYASFGILPVDKG